MTGVFHISQKVFGQVMAVTNECQTYRNVNRLLHEAKTLADIAEEELRLGIEAIILGAKHKSRQLNLIAEWHFHRCQAKAKFAQEKLSAAKDLNVNPRRNEYCRLKSQKMDELNARCAEMLRKLSRKNRTEVQTSKG